MKLLAGIRVLDLSRMRAGPHGSGLLADLGAEVIGIGPRRAVRAAALRPLIRGDAA